MTKSHFCLNCDDGTTMEFKHKDVEEMGQLIPQVLGWHCDQCGEIEFANGEGQRIWTSTHPTKIPHHTQTTEDKR